MINIVLAATFAWLAFDNYSQIDHIFLGTPLEKGSFEGTNSAFVSRVLEFSSIYREVFLALLAAFVFLGKSFV
ncbi:MAG: hypothetical protein KDD55_02285 [Bdellovibrionales bacterium]|nr:hypothetical protein [Bdellovibrionales bacterium]